MLSDFVCFYSLCGVKKKQQQNKQTKHTKGRSNEIQRCSLYSHSSVNTVTARQVQKITWKLSLLYVLDSQQEYLFSWLPFKMTSDNWPVMFFCIRKTSNRTAKQARIHSLCGTRYKALDFLHFWAGFLKQIKKNRLLSYSDIFWLANEPP